jgi:hypothetical protein
MSEKAVEEEIKQAKAAVAKAQTAYDEADDENRTLCFQLLLAEKNALAQLREERLIQQRAATGDNCSLVHSLVYAFRVCCENLCIPSLPTSSHNLRTTLCSFSAPFGGLRFSCDLTA